MNKKELHEICCPECHSKKVYNKWKYHNNSCNFYVFWCGDCGFGWRYPFASQNELKQQYNKQSLYELSSKNENNIGFRKRVNRLCAINSNRGRLLDIGSGPGHFLNLARKYGWQVMGIEPRKEAAKYCKEHFGIKIHNGFLEDFTEDTCVYDVITAWDVLEHVSNHTQFFDQCIKMLKPGGIFSFSIPNASGFPALIFKGRWRYVMPVHLNYFTMKYIYRFLSSRNLQLVHADHTFKIHSLIQGVATYIPFKIDTNKLFEFGTHNNKQVDQLKTKVKSLNHLSESNIVSSLRKFIFKINNLSFKCDKGDLVDFYCIKNN